MEFDRKKCEISLYPEKYDWYYAPDIDYTKTVVQQNAEIVNSASAIDRKNLPSKEYQKLLDGLIS